MSGKLKKILYWLICILLPAGILLWAQITKDIDATTKGFLAVTFIMYLIGLRIIWPILKTEGEFNNILNEYKEFDSSNLSNEMKYRKLVEVVDKTDSKVIKTLFNDFKKTLKIVNNDINEFGEKEKIYYSTNDIEFYFDEENVAYKNIKSRTLSQITQGLTAVGMFGTFLGIVKGVGGLDLDNADAMLDGIKILLGGVKTSFNSSLYGILFSVILTFALKIVVDLVMKQANDFCETVNEIIDPYTEQSALSDLENELKKQTSTFEQLATNLAEEMGKRFDDSIKDNINSLSSNIESVISEMKNSLSNSINDNSAQTVASLTSTMQPIMEKLGSMIDNMQANQQESTSKFFEESLSSIKEAINVGTSDEVSRLRESMDVISEKNSELLNTFTESMENMKELTKYQANLVQNTTSSTESMNVTTDNIKELQRDLSTVIGNLKDVNSTSNVSLENINKTIESMKVSMEKQMNINAALEEMITKSSALGENQTKYIDKFENISRMMSDNIVNSQSSMNELASEMNTYKNHFKSIKDSTLEVANTLDNKYKHITNNVEKANESLIETVEVINDVILNNVKDTSHSLTNVSNDLNKFQNKSNDLLNKIGQFADVEESTQKLWRDYKTSFETLNEYIKEGVLNYTKSMSTGVNSVFSEYDKSISEAVNSLRKMVEMLNESAENIAESVEALEKTKR